MRSLTRGTHRIPKSSNRATGSRSEYYGHLISEYRMLGAAKPHDIMRIAAMRPVPRPETSEEVG